MAIDIAYYHMLIFSVFCGFNTAILPDMKGGEIGAPNQVTSLWFSLF